MTTHSAADGIDRFVAIDWSGAKRPNHKLWLAEVAAGVLRRVIPLRSREHAADEVISACRDERRTVVGLDFAFSMPIWFLRSRILPTAFALWELAEKEGERWLRECAAPFWGRPGVRRPQIEAHFRRTEQDTPRVSGIAPKSCFQVGGAGAVGTGSIRGMPFLKRIRDSGVSVWPFDAPSLPLVAEIYPRILTETVNKGSPTARAVYLNRHWPNMTPELADVAASCEDAFDAAVSALVMDRHRAELARLPKIVDEIYRLEGLIWRPT